MVTHAIAPETVETFEVVVSSSMSSTDFKASHPFDEFVGYATVSPNFQSSCGYFEGNGDESEENSNSTFMDVVVSLYLPIALLWLQRCMFGTINIARSLILGHCLRLLLEMAPESWFQVPVLRWFVASKSDSGSWPPPALTLLAGLTIFVLVVHPDGLTWIILQKIRNAVSSLFHSPTQWYKMTKEYGVLPTLCASATLASLVFLAIIIRKTLSPRTPQKASQQPAAEKKKRKRKHHAQKGSRGSGRIKGIQSSRVSKQHKNLALVEETPAEVAATVVTQLEETTPHASPTPAPLLDPPTSPSKSETNVFPRQPVDSVPLLDDVSCESTSVRSVPSLLSTRSSVTSATSTAESSAEKQASRSKARPNRSKTDSSWKQPHTKRKNKNHPTKPNSAVSNVPAKPLSNPEPEANKEAPESHSSRWDALKPTHNNRTGGRRGGNHLHTYNNHNHHHPHHNHHHHPNRKGSKPKNRGSPYSPREDRHMSPADANGSYFDSPLSHADRHNTRPKTTTATVASARESIGRSDSPHLKPETTVAPPPGLDITPLATPLLDLLPRAINEPKDPESAKPAANSLPKWKGPDSSLLPPSHVFDKPSVSVDDYPSVLDKHSRAAVSPAMWSGSGQQHQNEGSEEVLRSLGELRGFAFGGSPFGNSFVGGSERVDADTESRIEAELQELGGQMAGSILDY